MHGIWLPSFNKRYVGNLKAFRSVLWEKPLDSPTLLLALTLKMVKFQTLIRIDEECSEHNVLAIYVLPKEATCASKLMFVKCFLSLYFCNSAKREQYRLNLHGY